MTTVKYVDINGLSRFKTNLGNLSNYKGHVNSSASLPQAGQPSGTMGTIGTNMSSLAETKLFKFGESRYTNYRTYKNYFVSVNWGWLGFLVATDYPEQVKLTGFKEQIFNSYVIPAVHITYDANKPVYYTAIAGTANPQNSVGVMTTAGTVTISDMSAGDWYTISQDTVLIGRATIRSDSQSASDSGTLNRSFTGDNTVAHITNNFPQLYFKNLGSTYNYSITSFGKTDSYKAADYIGNNAGTYFWTDGMIFSVCPDGNYTNTTYKTNESSVKDGDLYTVGSTNEIYRANNGAWEQWSQSPDISGKLDTTKVKSTTSTTAGDVYDVTYINSTLGDIETLLGGI